MQLWPGSPPKHLRAAGVEAAGVAILALVVQPPQRRLKAQALRPVRRASSKRSTLHMRELHVLLLTRYRDLSSKAEGVWT